MAAVASSLTMLGRRSDAHGSPVTDQDSCCSDDTVLSVGNEVENRLPDEGTAAAAAVSTLSFKNLEDHLNALSQGPSRLSPSNSSSRSCPSPPASFLFRAEHLVNFGYRGDNGGSSLCSPTSVRSDGADSPGSPGSRWAPAAVKSPNSPAESAFASSKHHHEPFGQQPEQGRPRAAPDAKSDNHQATLKFSIDNILKADFGRSRILDPIAIRKARPPPCKRAATSEGGFSGEQRSAPAAVGGESDRTGGPVDLSPGSDQGGGETKSESSKGDQPMLWPAWVYCTRYSDRPSSGRSPRTRRIKKPGAKGAVPEEKRPRTAFSGAQLARLKHEFAENRYLTERRRQQLSAELGLNEAQIKIWFQNKRAKIKKASGQKNPLALQLMAQGLYNHSTIPLTKEEEELEKLQTQSKVT